MKETTAWDHMTKRNGFLDAQLGKGWGGPFTGFSWKALRAFIELVDCWYAADMQHRPRIESAMRDLTEVFQQSELPVVRLTIYGRGNESDMLDLWPRIDPGMKGGAA
jgi:hypothetical protein